ncbi:F-actin-capping protein subunit alpha [Ascobolus immersus RN42]|uniref:F-actin-capping protein subunit alpha n=1 Tax=Ascobolus immersus RN42 TaxID=1160509 RepID=A0A3N4HGE1_ASCIM|nr:F-actin-capping protein subunit alpha [Ascobolus immersus RN42]
MDTQEKIETTSAFVLDAPPGELTEVLEDIKNLTYDTPSVLPGLTPALTQYNESQLTLTKLPGSSESVIVSSFNKLPDGRYFDPASSTSFDFDHQSRKASNPQSHVLEGENAELIKNLLRDLAPHVAEHYPTAAAFSAYPTPSSDEVTIVITGSKYSPSNFWNGRWRSIYTLSSNTLTGSILVDVHYYEDGNVRLQTNKKVDEELGGSSSREVVKAIAGVEKRYQEELNRAFLGLSEGAFKGLRRQLPVTRQKVEWEKISGYRVGQDIGGGSSRR